ncbi:hypothetical protein LCGC14_1984370 [marine sediment metagenome]|uniref:Uncharacterized protein n=1 Tax=marine sediment metagenome TaxID=412755 RepID=A0A0F9I528_9ZZZZ
MKLKFGLKIKILNWAEQISREMSKDLKKAEDKRFLEIVDKIINKRRQI